LDSLLCSLKCGPKAIKQKKSHVTFDSSTTYWYYLINYYRNTKYKYQVLFIATILTGRSTRTGTYSLFLSHLSTVQKYTVYTTCTVLVQLAKVSAPVLTPVLTRTVYIYRYSYTTVPVHISSTVFIPLDVYIPVRTYIHKQYTSYFVHYTGTFRRRIVRLKHTQPTVPVRYFSTCSSASSAFEESEY
jgi:hypothetical protein